MSEKKSEWIATEWQRADDLGNFNALGVSIHLSVSPFYAGTQYAVRGPVAKCLNKSGKWEREPQPSSRTPAFFKRCRFSSFDDALKALAKATPPSQQDLS